TPSGRAPADGGSDRPAPAPDRARRPRYGRRGRTRSVARRATLPPAVSAHCWIAASPAHWCCTRPSRRPPARRPPACVSPPSAPPPSPPPRGVVLPARGPPLARGPWVVGVRRNPPAAPILHAGDVLAAARAPPRLDGRVRALEVVHRLEVVDVPDGLALGRAHRVHRQAVDLERVGPPPEQERPAPPLVADAERHRFLLDAQRRIGGAAAGGRTLSGLRIGGARREPETQQRHESHRSDRSHESSSCRISHERGGPGTPARMRSENCGS